MMIVLLIAGICAVLAGVLAILEGIPVKEFSFGNTLILAGAVAVGSGMILLAQVLVVRELKNIARRLGPRTAAELRPRAMPAAPAALAQSAGEDSFPFPRDQDAFPFPRDQDASAELEPRPATQPWRQDAASRDRTRQESVVPQPEPGEPAPPKRRNPLFSSSVRKDRERAQARAGEPAPSDFFAPPPPDPDEVPPASFDDAWPKPERLRASEPPQRRTGRAPSTFADANAAATAADRAPQAPRSGDQTEVTVLKSGVVDGMAYSLYSDGSIEAQMPEGMMRFASIDELRAHIDQRP